MKENIEEDIIVIEKLIRTMEQDIATFKDEKSKEIYAYFIKALKNILSDYKRVLKENEEWQRAYQEEKDKQFELVRENQKLQKENEELKDKWDKDTHKLQNDLDIANAEKIEIQKENEQLKHKYDKALSDVIAGVDLDNTYISKQKIKDKIEELKNKSGGNVFHIQQTINAEIRLLKDLLEEKGE